MWSPNLNNQEEKKEVVFLVTYKAKIVGQRSSEGRTFTDGFPRRGFIGELFIPSTIFIIYQTMNDLANYLANSSRIS